MMAFRTKQTVFGPVLLTMIVETVGYDLIEATFDLWPI